MKRRLILHLGLPKTGTTSIQAFLRKNPDTLAAAGILYPKVGTDVPDHPAFQSRALRSNLAEETNHVALASEIFNRRRRTEQGQVAVHENVSLWSVAFEQIEKFDAHTTIISYENFSTGPQKYDFEILRERFSNFEVHGIVYLRDVEGWSTSLYAQMIRGEGRFSKSFSRFASPARLSLAYSETLDAIRDKIPLDRLVVGNFDEAAASGLLEDFFDKAELPRQQLLSGGQPSVRNSSLPYWAVLFLLKCNERGLSNPCFLEVRRALNISMRRRPPMLKPGLDIATPEERQRIRHIGASDAKRLARRYGVTLTPAGRESIAYRPFDDADFETIGAAISRWLSQPTRDALEHLRPAPRSRLRRTSDRAE